MRICLYANSHIVQLPIVCVLLLSFWSSARRYQVCVTYHGIYFPVLHELMVSVCVGPSLSTPEHRGESV